MIEEWIMGKGTAVWEVGFLWRWTKALGRWYRSKDKVQLAYSPFTFYMINKKWWLEEQFNVHMMRFQQVKIVCNLNNLPFFDSRLVC